MTANQVVETRGAGAPPIAVRTRARSDRLRIQGQNLACLRPSPAHKPPASAVEYHDSTTPGNSHPSSASSTGRPFRRRRRRRRPAPRGGSAGAAAAASDSTVTPPSRSAKPGVVVGRQAVEEEARVAGDQRRGGLEVPGLALDQGAAGVVEFGGRRRAVADQRLDLAAEVVERLGQPVGLEAAAIDERPRAAAAVEMAPDAVGEPFLLAELGIEPRRELAAEDLVQDQHVGVIGVEPRHADVADPHHRLGRAGAVEQQEPGAVAPRRGSGVGRRDLGAGPVREPGVEAAGDLRRGRRRRPRRRRRGPGRGSALVELPRGRRGRAWRPSPRRRRSATGRGGRAVERPEQAAVAPRARRCRARPSARPGSGRGSAPTPTRGRSGCGGRPPPGRGSPARCGVRHWRPTYEPSQPQLVERLVPIPSAARAIVERRTGSSSPRPSSPAVSWPGRRGPARCSTRPAAEDERRGDDRQVAPGDDPERHPAAQASRTSGLGARNGRGRGARRGDRRSSGRRGRLRRLPADDRQRHPGPPDQVAPGRLADRLGRDRLIPLEVGRDPPRVAEIDVVGVEPVGDAAEPADVVERVEEPGEPAVLDPLQLRVGHARLGDRRELGVDQSRARSRDCPGRSVTTTPKLPASSRPDW